MRATRQPARVIQHRACHANSGLRLRAIHPVHLSRGVARGMSNSFAKKWRWLPARTANTPAAGLPATMEIFAMSRGATKLAGLVIALLLPLALTGCTPEPPPAAACKWQVPVDGHITLQPEFAHFKLKLPEGLNYSLTSDCKYMRSAIAELIWNNGRLMTQLEYIRTGESKNRVAVLIIIGAFRDFKIKEGLQNPVHACC